MRDYFGSFYASKYIDLPFQITSWYVGKCTALTYVVILLNIFGEKVIGNFDKSALP